jgi:transposase
VEALRGGTGGGGPKVVAGAHASANLYSLVETCKANVIDPNQYLVWLFKKLPLANSADDYAALLPWRIAD